MSLWYQVTTWNRFPQDIQDRKDDFHSMLSSEAVTETTPQTHFLFFYLLPKKKKMFYHKSHWNVLLKKKIYLYFSHFSAFFPPFFLLLFRKRFVIIHQKQNFFSFFLFFFKSGTSVGRRRVPTSVSPNQRNKTNKQKKCTKKYVIHSYHFGFIN